MLNEIVLIVFYIMILGYTIIIHEISHGMAAYLQGDLTAKYAGRLSLNPLKHIDPWGTIIVPILMVLLTSFAFGWAKPVPYNPYNLKNQRWGSLLVALAGPASNLIIALVFAIAASLINIPEALKIDIISNFSNWKEISHVISNSFGAIFYEIFIIIIYWNTILAFFNLIPIPPLDGSKILFGLVRVKPQTVAMLEQFGFTFLLIFMILFYKPIGIVIFSGLSIFFSIAI